MKRLSLLAGVAVLAALPSGGASAGSAAGMIVLEGHQGTGKSERVALYLVRPDGTGVRKLPGAGRFSGEPSWSADGRKIAFTSNRAGDPAFASSNEIFVMNADGTKATQLTINSLEEHDPAYAPRGRLIAYAGDQGVKVIDDEGTIISNITGEVPLRRPTWSGDRTRLAFSSGPNRKLPSSQIYVVGYRGTSLKRITQIRGGAAEPDWSPDSRSIVFVAGRPGDVYVMRPDGTGVRRLTRTPAAEWSPAWSPDGRKILFTRGSSHKALWVMDATGRNPKRLLSDPKISFERPDWR